MDAPNYQNKYRHKQAIKGLVRYEFQIEKETRDRFEEIISETAKELPEPYSLRQRKTQSRALVFNEMVTKLEHNFFYMQDQHIKWRDNHKKLTIL